MRADAWDTHRVVFRLLAGAVLVLLAALSGLAFSLPPSIARAAGANITIASPSSASGPIETHIQIGGDNWAPNANVRLFYNQPANNQPCGDPNNAVHLADTQPIVTSAITASQGGAWVIKTQWPSTTTGNFYICGFDTTTPTQVVHSDQTFNVLSTTLPSLDPPTPTLPNVGDQIKISGHGFLPGNQPVDLWLTQTPDNPTQGASLGNATPDSSGSFTQTVMLPTNLSGNLTIVAQSRPSVSGAAPPLVASMDVTIGATPSTVTPTPAGSATADPTARATATALVGTGTGSSSGSSASRAILAVLLVLLTLVILAIFGVLIWYFAGIRPPAGGGARPPPAPSRTRAPAAPRRGQTGRASQPGWQDEDEWEDQQGPWEEDEQGTWGSSAAWGNNADLNAPRSGPPRSRPPSRDDWRDRSGPSQGAW